MAWKVLFGMRSRGTRRVTKVYSASCLKMDWNSASWKNNSASRLKIALDSASLFLDLASQVAKPRTLRVKTRISELSGNSVSWKNNSASRLKIALDSASLVVRS